MFGKRGGLVALASSTHRSVVRSLTFKVHDFMNDPGDHRQRVVNDSKPSATRSTINNVFLGALIVSYSGACGTQRQRDRQRPRAGEREGENEGERGTY